MTGHARGLHRPHRVELMGMGIDCVREHEAIEVIVDAAAGGRGGWVITPNLDQLRRFVDEPELRVLFRRADLVLVDGTTLVWASRILGTPLPERVPGSTLAMDLAAAAAEANLSLFLLGGNPGTAKKAAEQLTRRLPKLSVVGSLCPPVGFERMPAELARIETALARAQPHLVYVCLGFPKQERLIQRLGPRFPHTWFLGLGVSLSFVAGELVRAPPWMQRLGAEWLHRMVQEPRLFHRFVVRGIPFSARLFAHAARARLLSTSVESAASRRG